MTEADLRMGIPRPARQALWLWLLFLCAAVVLNGTLPFVAGADLHAWTDSRTKAVLFGLVIYGCVFMLVPIAATRGRAVVRGTEFWIVLLLGVAALALRPFYRPLALITLAALTYLHLRYGLSDLGVKAPVRRRDLAVVLVLGLLPMTIRIFSPPPWSWHPAQALGAGLDRLLLNPASTTENLFYFGFLTERLRPWAGRWRTPALVGSMYTAHEMSNPEYWYEGMNFPLVFVGVAMTAAAYSWCRNTVAIWLSSGLARFVTALW